MLLYFFPPGSLTGFIQKNPFKIHKHFTNLCNRVWKSNMKVLNSSTHQVKGCNPYYSQRPCIQSVKTHRKCVLCDFAQHFFFIDFLSTIQSWEMQFLTDKLIVFPWHSEDHKFTNFHRPHSVCTTFKALKSISHFPPLPALI